MASSFGLFGFLFSKNFPLLVCVVALDYLGMYFLNLGDIVESVLFFMMIALAFVFSYSVHSAGTLLRLVFVLFAVDLLMRWGLHTVLPQELISVTTENMIQGVYGK